MPSAIARYYSELKRRKVLRTAVAYLVTGWLIIEVASVLIPTLLLPEWSMRMLTLVVILGFPVTVVLAWVFDVTPGGVTVTGAEATQPAAGSGSPAASATVPAASNIPAMEDAVASVAVLPFDVSGGNPEHRMFADGVAAEIHSRLSKLNQVRVASRRTAERLSEQALTMTEIAERIQVRYVLSGNIVHAGDRVRIIAELDDATREEQIWSARYERSLEDVFSVMSDIAEQVVGAFGSERLKLDLERARSRAPDNVDAWDLVHKARSYLLDTTRESNQLAREALAKAVELDGEYAQAHATLGMAYADSVLNGISDNEEADCRNAEAAILRANELTVSDADVLKMSGMVWTITGQATRAIEALHSAVDLAPYDFGAWGYMGWPLTTRGRTEDVDSLHDILARILSVAPDHPGVAFWHHHRSVAYACSNELDQAAEFARLALEKHPALSWGWMNYANVLCRLDRADQAADAIQRAQAANPRMTCAHYVAQIERMAEGEGFVTARTAGLREAGLV